MKLSFTTGQWSLIFFNVLLASGFALYFSQDLNWEFVAYAGTIFLITVFLFGTLNYTRFPTWLLAGISLWALLHMLGGTNFTGEGVLYTYKIYPLFDGGGEFFVLKFDQVVHMYLYGVVGLMFYHVLHQVLGVQKNRWLVALVAILAASGLGMMNEIIEFLAVVNLPQTGVGGYYNTLLDLIFNLIGATFAVVVLSSLRE